MEWDWFNDNRRMVSTLQSKWAVAGSTFVLWALVAVSAAYWALKLSSTGATPMAPTVVRAPAPADPAAVARLLGASPKAAEAAPAASLASRFALLGVVAGADGRGAALIAVDGRPAKPFRVGSTVDEGLVLQSVQGRRAVLATAMDGPTALALELPPLKK